MRSEWAVWGWWLTVTTRDLWQNKLFEGKLENYGYFLRADNG